MSENLEGRIGNLPRNINSMIPTPRPDAKQITKLVKQSGRITGYQLSSGEVLSKQQAVELAKTGGIRGVAVARRKDSEYLRTLPDENDGNNLGNLPTMTQ